jgi:hypothetical protein
VGAGVALAPDPAVSETTLALTSTDGTFPEQQAADRMVRLLQDADAHHDQFDVGTGPATSTSSR